MKYEAQRCLPAQHLKILWFPTGGDGFQAQAGVSYKCKASRALKIGSKTLAGWLLISVLLALPQTDVL